jgi:hypothetical protein
VTWPLRHGTANKEWDVLFSNSSLVFTWREFLLADDSHELGYKAPAPRRYPRASRTRPLINVRQRPGARPDPGVVGFGSTLIHAHVIDLEARGKLRGRRIAALRPADCEIQEDSAAAEKGLVPVPYTSDRLLTLGRLRPHDKRVT